MHLINRLLASATAVVTLATAPPPVLAQVKTYNVALLSDFSGPFANVMKPVAAGRDAVFKWWNEEVGKKLGVQINTRTYDTRYDAAQVASLWPGILSELKPILLDAVGTPDVAALGDRLPEAKVPMITLGGATHAGWKDDSWVFFPRPTYAHEAAALLEWLHGSQKRTTPIKVAVIGSQQVLLSVDLYEGLQAYAKQHKDKAAVVDVIWDAPQPADLTGPMRRVVGSGAEVIFINTNTAAAVATKRALQALGKKIPIVTTSQNSLPIIAKTLGGLDQLEGDFEVYGLALSTEEDQPARKFYDELVAQHGLRAPWGVLTLQGMSQAILSVRSIEAAIRKFGPSELDGDKVRQAMLSEPITGNRGVIPDFSFTKQATFPSERATVNVGTVKDGKYVAAATDVPIPALKRW